MTHVKTPAKERPLSPHLSIYKPQITSVMSITHRATGVFNLLGLYVFALWIAAVAFSATIYDLLVAISHHWTGNILLSLWVISITYHLLNGVRHLAWDMGKGLDIPNVTRSGILVLLLTLLVAGGVLYSIFGCGCFMGVK